MTQIIMKNVSKRFRRYKKKKGFINNFFNREYENVLAINNVNISINEGEIVGLLGSNGAGKTTIMKMLSGLIEPSSGEINVLGVNPFQKKVEFKKQISLVLGQKQQLWWDIPAIESFKLNKSIYGIEDEQFRDILNNLIEMLDIHDVINSPVRTLSLGERMKCELVLALLHSPKILFLDEPTIGLDLLAQKNIRDFIKEYNKKYNATVIITSHYMDDIEELCDRTIFIDKGTKYYDGTLDGFLNTYGKECILNIEFLESLDDDKLLFLKNYGTIIKVINNKCKLKVDKDKSSEVKKILLSLDSVSMITIDQMDASEIVRSYFEKEIG